MLSQVYCVWQVVKTPTVISKFQIHVLFKKKKSVLLVRQLHGIRSFLGS